MVVDNIHRLDHVDMTERDADAEFRRHLALILLLILALPPRSELLDNVRRPALLLIRLDQTHRPTRTRP